MIVRYKWCIYNVSALNRSTLCCLYSKAEEIIKRAVKLTYEVCLESTQLFRIIQKQISLSSEIQGCDAKWSLFPVQMSYCKKQNEMVTSYERISCLPCTVGTFDKNLWLLLRERHFSSLFILLSFTRTPFPGLISLPDVRPFDATKVWRMLWTTANVTDSF